MEYTIDIDTGGTFTDGFFVHGKEVTTVKVPTTPHDLTVCFLKCIETGAQKMGLAVEDLLYRTSIIRFSNTIGTNTIIQRDGSKIGLLVTAGTELLAPTQGNGAAPLVQPDMVLGLDEEVDAAGRVVKSPTDKAVLSAAQTLIDRGARCLVAALSRADVNPANERFVRQAIKREYPRDFLGSVPVFLSSDISRRPGEAERLNGAVLNAYIHAKLVRLLYKAGEELCQRLYPRNLFIVHNNGAVTRVAKTRAINTYNSGPAAGLLGARLVGALYGGGDIISADMGGTSFDLGYVRQDQPSYSLQPDVEGFPVNVPMLSIRAIGAGGGSIAAVKNGVLSVGPRSAGAMPGPACFDLGGAEPTVTDADLVLGLLDPDYFLGGEMKLNADKARAAIRDKVAGPLSLSVEEAALAIKGSIDDAMGRELKKLKGEVMPASRPLLVVYGGAGPTHCCGFAKAAGIGKIIITPFSGVFSAFSSVSMDVGHLYYRRLDVPLGDPVGLQALAGAVDGMDREAVRDMRGEGFALDEVTRGLELFVRSPSGGPEVKIVTEADFFKDAGKVKAVSERASSLLAAAGAKDSSQPVIGTAGLLVSAPMDHYTAGEAAPANTMAEAARKGNRKVYLGGGRQMEDVAVYDRAGLTLGHALSGPAIVESDHTTVFIPRGWGLRVDRFNNAVVEEKP